MMTLSIFILTALQALTLVVDRNNAFTEYFKIILTLRV